MISVEALAKIGFPHLRYRGAHRLIFGVDQPKELTRGNLIAYQVGDVVSAYGSAEADYQVDTLLAVATAVKEFDFDALAVVAVINREFLAIGDDVAISLKTAERVQPESIEIVIESHAVNVGWLVDNLIVRAFGVWPTTPPVPGGDASASPGPQVPG